MSISIEVSELAPSLNVLMRMHYHTYGKLRDKWTWLVREQAGTQKSAAQFHIRIDRYYAVHPLDMDALYARKIEIDALCNAGIIPDDNPNAMTGLSCSQTKVNSRKLEKTVITIL